MHLRDDVSNLKKSLADEQRKRLALQAMIQKNMNNNTNTTSNVPDV
jgi:hypothetical protein